LLQKNPEKRFTIKEIKDHEFFRGLDWEGVFKKEYQTPKVDFEPIQSLKIDKVIYHLFHNKTKNVAFEFHR